MTLGEPSVAAAPGAFYVFRDRAERATFLASRYRRRADPRPRLRTVAAEQHRALLEALAAFVLERGRLPREGELAAAEAITSALGSEKRAGALLGSVGLDEGAIAAVRKGRSRRT